MFIPMIDVIFVVWLPRRKYFPRAERFIRVQITVFVTVHPARVDENVFVGFTFKNGTTHRFILFFVNKDILTGVGLEDVAVHAILTQSNLMALNVKERLIVGPNQIIRRT